MVMGITKLLVILWAFITGKKVVVLTDDKGDTIFSMEYRNKYETSLYNIGCYVKPFSKTNFILLMKTGDCFGLPRNINKWHYLDRDDIFSIKSK